MVKPPVVLAAACCARSTSRSPASTGSGSATAPASASTTRRTSRAGTTSAGSTRTRSARRWEIANYALEGKTFHPDDEYPAETADQALAEARAVWGEPEPDGRDGRARSRSSSRRSRGDEPRGPDPRAAPERAPPAHRRLPRLPDLLRTVPMKPCHCKDYTRSAIMREAAAKAGGGLRAIEPGMPLPAGTGLSRRSFLARSSGLALAVFGGAALAPARVGRGIAAAAAAGAGRARRRLRLHVGRRRLALDARAGRRPRYASLRPRSRSAPARRRASARIRGCAGTRSSRRSARCTRRARSP